MDKLMVCVDLTGLSRRVVDKAIELGKKINGEIVMVHVRQKSPTMAHATANHSDRSAKKLILENNELDKLEEQLRDSGLTFSIKQPMGEVSKEVAKLLEEINPFCLIMGSAHNSALHHVVSGSVAGELLEKSSTPVMLVS